MLLSIHNPLPSNEKMRKLKNLLDRFREKFQEGQFWIQFGQFSYDFRVIKIFLKNQVPPGLYNHSPEALCQI